MNKNSQTIIGPSWKRHVEKSEGFGRAVAMMVFINLLLLIVVLFVSGVLLTSCLKENMLNCPEQIRVYFTYTDNRTLTGEGYPINPEHVDRMHLYVFNEKGYYIDEYCDENIVVFDEAYYIDCSDLLPGRYSFIAWGGKNEDSYFTALANSSDLTPFVKNKTGFDEVLLMLKRSGNDVSTPVHHLFHSDIPATVAYTKIQRFDMPLMQLTNTINIRTVKMTANANNYRFDIMDNNDAYTFDGFFATDVTDPSFTYTTPCTKNNTGQVSATLNVMRLAENRHTPQLQVYNESSDEVLFQSDDLIKLILKANPENDFDTTHIYNIDIIFDSDDDLQFTIFVNGWVVREQDDDLFE